MAFTDKETEAILNQLEEEFWVHHRPPHHLRDKVREGQRLDKQSIELFLKHPSFQRPGEWIEDGIARIRYFRSRDAWAIYWQRADLKWHRYDPFPETSSLSAALITIGEDEHCCFFG